MKDKPKLHEILALMNSVDDWTKDCALVHEIQSIASDNFNIKKKNNTINMSVLEYQNYKKDGLLDREIAFIIDVNLPSLKRWKKVNNLTDKRR